MKIAWFTPLDNKSAIGRIGLEICEQLGKTNDVTVWGFEKEHILQTGLDVCFYNPDRLDKAKLKSYDTVIYNIGNNDKYHLPIIKALRQFPGMVILHDQIYHGLFYHAAKNQNDYCSGMDIYSEAMFNEYGERGLSTARNILSTEGKDITDTSFVFPLLYEICQYARGIFTHAEFFTKILSDYYNGPIDWSYLPYKHTYGQHEGAFSNVFTRDKNKLLVVSNGIVHPIKRIDKITEVLLENEDIREKIQYVVIGSYGGQYGENLKALSEGRLKGCLYMLDYQPNEVMEGIIDACDVCINLRYPNSEVCSLSLLEQMAAGKPVIVLDGCVYGEMPDDTVIKISREKEKPALATVLREIIADRESSKLIGERAAKFVLENCNTAAYASRLIKFIQESEKEIGASVYKANALNDVRREMIRLGYASEKIPLDIDDIVYHISKVYGAIDTKESDRNTIALWIGFTRQVPGLEREGIIKFCAKMTEALLRYTELNIELWTYSINEESIFKAFQNSLNSNGTRITVITEKNWKSVLDVPSYYNSVAEEITVEKDNLAFIAKQFSKAAVFVPAILYLDNVLCTGKPLCIPAHDMAVKYHYEEFLFENDAYIFHSRDIDSSIERMARRNPIMFSLSNTVREAQILPCVKNTREEYTDYVWVPDGMLPQSEENIADESILQKFGIKGPYLFYPTQIRPHKNFGIILDAMVILFKEFPDLCLVTTGNICDLPDVDAKAEELGIKDSIIPAGHVSNAELMTLYQFAACVPVPTLMEGGFPMQALEAIRFGTPTVISDIAVVRERISALDLTPEKAGVRLFDPRDAAALAMNIRDAIIGRNEFIENQERFKEYYNSSCNWEEAAKKYYALLMRAADNNEIQT